MIEKNLAYSIDEINGFLMKMQGVSETGENTYRYKSTSIALQQLEPVTYPFPTERCAMRLYGNKVEIDEFYYIFLVNHLKMGG